METKSISVGQEQVLLDLLAGLEDQVYVNAFAGRLANILRLKAANPLLRVSLVTGTRPCCLSRPAFPVRISKHLRDR